MVEPITINIRHLSQDVRLPQEQVQSAIDLLDAGFPVPFIARYRKESTKNLDEESLRHIAEELRSARALCERKQTILKTIEAAGKLNPDLDKSIREAKSVKKLEDLYLPFKPKRQTFAAAARESGLEPLALEILEGSLLPDKVDERAAEFINEEKKVKSVADALLGTGHIIADIFSCKAEIVHKVRELLYQYGYLTTTKIETAADRKKAENAKHAPNAHSAGTPVPPPTESAESTEAEPAESAAELNEPEIPPEEVTAEEITGEILDESPESTESEATDTEEIDTEGLNTEGVSDGVDEMETLEEGTEEVTALFKRLKEAQTEKGLPMVRSQNAIKKKKRAEAKKKLDEIKQRQREHFERQFAEYFNFSIKLRGIPAHRILAFNRGERHKIIQVAFKIDEAKVLESVKEICIPQDHVHAEFLTGCLQDALHRGVLPMLTREIRDDMTEYAEKNIIKAFGKNLRNLLLQRPFLQKRVLALDPNNKTGCKAVALDEFGNLLGHETVFIAVNAERRAGAEQTLAEMIRRFGLSVIGIGNGSGSRAVEESVAHMIETHFTDAQDADSHSTDSHSADSGLMYVVVNKFGSSAYSASQIAKEEFPNEDPFVRTAIFIGRRLQNPLNELVKIEPSSLGAGMIQHEIRGKYLKPMLAEVVESCVNLVGVDLNAATPAILTYVAGLNLMTARRIYEYRHEHGHFQTRDDLKKVSGISETVYTLAAGFLRITGGGNPLDSTGIHPESYELAANIVERLGFSVHDLQSNERRKALSDKIAAEKIGELTLKLSSDFHAGIHLVRDILEELSEPERDPRDSQPPLPFRKTPLKFESLTAGMELTGTIQNVTDFGAFVDIGLHESGFIHISQMASGYIQNAHEKVFAGDTVRLWVVEADAAKKRVSLTLLPPGTEKQVPPSRFADKERERPPREHSHHTPRPDREPHRELPGKPEGERSSRQPFRGTRDGKREDGRREWGNKFDRTPKTFASAPVKKEMKPITEKMKQGKEPMRSFADLAQLFGRVQTDTEEGKREKK